MKFNFRKIASVAASAAMAFSTIGFAAAATYPAPFVSGGTADGAVVYGSSAAMTDIAAAIDVAQKLNAQVTSSATTTDTTITGEAAPLFTASSKIYANDSLNSVKSVVTKTDLPTILEDGDFSGDVDATFTQTINLGSNPTVVFAKQPTSDSDPEFGLSLSTSTSNYIYNASATFNKAVNFTHSDSKGSEITLFGQKFTVASSTDTTNLVLLKSAEKINLDSDNPTTEVTIGGETYTIELISASDSSATIKVTDSSGTSDSKEVTESSSKKINGVTIAVTNADETNLKLTATIIAGAEKVTLTDGSSVTTGDSGDVIDGTLVSFTGDVDSLTKIVVSVAAPNSDSDAIKPGEDFVDPVFGTFKIDFTDLNIPEDSSSREDIAIKNSGDDKMEVTMTDTLGNEKTFQWAKNTSSGIELQHDNEGRNISVREMDSVYRNDYVIVGNEDEGHLLKVYTITNQTTGYSNDKVKLQDVFSGDTYEATLTAEGTGTITIGGKVYDIDYYGAQTLSEDLRYVKIGYPDSSGSNSMVIYPTIQTSKGAKVFLYEPLTIDVGDWDGNGNGLTQIRIPDGDGYEDIVVANNVASGNFSIDSSTLNAAGESTTVSVGQLTYNFTYAGENTTTVYLVNPEGGNIVEPALGVIEEKDESSGTAVYNAMIVTLEPGATGDDGIGVNDVIRTWSSDGTWDSISLASDSKKSKEADTYGSIITIDSSDSDQKTATISYPDEQIYAQIYVADTTASITPGSTTTGSGGQVLIVEDSAVSSVADKNLFVVGGSCVNTVAAELLGSSKPLCGSDFTDKTGISTGGYIIEVFSSPYATADSGKIAMLVAGYGATDTVSAVAAVDGLENADVVGTTVTYPTVTSTTTTDSTTDTTTDSTTDTTTDSTTDTTTE